MTTGPPDQPSAADEERVPTGQILVYSLPVVGVFFANLLLSFYFLKFATDVLLVSPAVAGTILLVGRLWDAVTDPLVGTWSDRTRTSFGRRRPWLLGSALPLGLSIVALWSPPQALEGRMLTLWLTLALLAYLTFYTTFRVPHMALGAELSRGYHDRTRVFGILQIVEFGGVLLAALGLGWIENASVPREAAATLSRGMAALVIALLVLATWRMRERGEFQGRGSTDAYRAFRDVLANPHARMLVLIFFLEQIGFVTLMTLLPYLSDYVLGTPGQTSVYLGATIISGAVTIPAWISLSRRYGKRRTWLASVAIKFAAFLALGFVGTQNASLLIGVSIVLGVTVGAGNVIGPSLKADVIDWDEAASGERKEGAYFAAWNFVQKAAAGFSGWVVGMALAATGFVPNAAQSGETLAGLRVLASIWPAVVSVVIFAMIWRFGLDESAHSEARARAEARDA